MKYNLVDSYKPHLINSFQTIGWPDPFPNDCKEVTGSIEDGHNLVIPSETLDLVYLESRYYEEASPLCIYIPKKEVMLKIMRACIGATKTSDFWLIDSKLKHTRTKSFYENVFA